MTKTLMLAAGLAALTVMPSSGQEPQGLTASIGTTGLVCQVASKSNCSILLLLVNNGSAEIDTHKLGLEFYIDGKLVPNERADFLYAYASIPAGEHRQWGARMDLFIKDPGVHRLSWKGRGFSSNEAQFLLLPAE